jgi:hypothetical protein
MSISKTIYSAEGCKIGTMECARCLETIKSGKFLAVTYYVSKRGNEDDYVKLYHEMCSTTDNVWKEEKLEEEKEQIFKNHQLAINKAKAISLINKATSIEFEVDDEYSLTEIWVKC